MKRLFALTLAILMMLSVFTGCGGEKAAEEKPAEAPAAAGEAAAPAAPEQLDIVRVGVTAWPASLDPVTKMGWTQTRILYQVYDTLLYCNDDSTISSYICDS